LQVNKFTYRCMQKRIDTSNSRMVYLLMHGKIFHVKHMQY